MATNTVVFLKKNLRTLQLEEAIKQTKEAGYQVDETFTKRTCYLVCDAATKPWGRSDVIGVRVLTERMWRKLIHLPEDERLFNPVKIYNDAVRLELGNGVKRDLLKAMELYKKFLKIYEEGDEDVKMEITYVRGMNRKLNRLPGHVEDLTAYLEKRPLRVNMPPRFDLAACGYVFAVEQEYYTCDSCGIEGDHCLCAVCFHNTDHEGHKVALVPNRWSQSFCDCGYGRVWQEGRSVLCSAHAPELSLLNL